MNDLSKLLQQVNDSTKEKPIFFITNDPERGFGLEKVLEHFHIACVDDNDVVDYLLKSNVNVFSLEKELSSLNAIYRNSHRLLKHEKTKEYITKHSSSGGQFMFFKIAPNLEKISREYGFSLLNTTSDLNRTYEQKISQYEALKDFDVRFPKTIITTLQDADYREIVGELDEPFVLQFNRGHTGGGTEFIDSELRFDEIKKQFPERTVRLAKYIEGDAFTINACVTKYGVCYGGLSYQITGIEELTSQKAGTVGNDWSHTKELSDIIREDIYRQTVNVGEAMKENGFQGMFGLDFVMEQETRAAFLIEVNARQPASISMHTKIQLANKQIPLSLLAIAEFMGIDHELDVKRYNEQAVKPTDHAQVFIRNKYANKVKVIGGVKPGAYRMSGTNTAYRWKQGRKKLTSNVIFLDEDKAKPLIYLDDDYAIDGLDESGLLLLSIKEGKIISSNAEIARIQLKQSVLDNNGEILHWVKEIVSGLQSNIILQEVK